ncbi:MAG: DUF1538 domain-containing protein [Thiotrichales bacterium]
MNLPKDTIGASQPIRLDWHGTFTILYPYIQEKLLEQIKSVWFIIAYLFFFQIVVLQLPVIYSVMIGIGIAVVAIGLMFFMEGLRLGLMPLGEAIGVILPNRSKIPMILLFAFLLGIGATFAEPAISVLKSAGAGIVPDQAPLLYSLLNDFSAQLVGSVGVGVGIAVALGVLRFFYNWPLKLFIIPLVLLLIGMTLWTESNEILRPIIGLAWDSGAVTTGPVTVPLVLALGIGVCRIVGDGDTSNAGFGIVTLASLFPIIAVLLLGNYHFFAKDYYGAENYQGQTLQISDVATTEQSAAPKTEFRKGFTEEEFQAYLNTGEIPVEYEVHYSGGETLLKDGRIEHLNAVIELVKTEAPVQPLIDSSWSPDTHIVDEFIASLWAAIQAILPLCLFLFITLRFFLRERLEDTQLVVIGIGFALLGMLLFGLGITLGLLPLGTQLGANIPSAFTPITPWGMEGVQGPLFGEGVGGKAIAILFGFFLGYGATLAEPALNALGETVEKITVGAFPKSLLMQSVALGVALGIATGVLKIAFNIPLIYLLLPPYIVLLFLTWISSEEFVNFGWDSAGVTTGPITVPLVLSMGLGIGANIPGVKDGFGILALASVGPIITVLTVGLIVARIEKSRDNVSTAG